VLCKAWPPCGTGHISGNSTVGKPGAALWSGPPASIMSLDGDPGVGVNMPLAKFSLTLSARDIRENNCGGASIGNVCVECTSACSRISSGPKKCGIQPIRVVVMSSAGGLGGGCRGCGDGGLRDGKALSSGALYPDPGPSPRRLSPKRVQGALVGGSSMLRGRLPWCDDGRVSSLFLPGDLSRRSLLSVFSVLSVFRVFGERPSFPCLSDGAWSGLSSGAVGGSGTRSCPLWLLLSP